VNDRGFEHCYKLYTLTLEILPPLREAINRKYAEGFYPIAMRAVEALDGLETELEREINGELSREIILRRQEFDVPPT